MAIQATGTHTAQVNVARIVTAFLMLLLSMGRHQARDRLSRSRGRTATRSEAAAERALETTPDELGALKVMSDYISAVRPADRSRHGFGRLREKNLNQTWKELRNGTGER